METRVLFEGWKTSHKSQEKVVTMQVQNADETGALMDPSLEMALSGDQELLGQIFSRYTNLLYRTAVRMLGSREEAEDAVQDALLSAVKNLKSFG